MKYPFLFSLASLESPSRSDSAETVVKILHIYPVPKVLEIWQSAALEYEKANPAVKIEFEYLENEEFKAKLPRYFNPTIDRACSTVGAEASYGSKFRADSVKTLPRASLETLRIHCIRPGFKPSWLRANRTGYLTALVRSFSGITRSYARKRTLIH
jgi:hypothetical protein